MQRTYLALDGSNVSVDAPGLDLPALAVAGMRCYWRGVLIELLGSRNPDWADEVSVVVAKATLAHRASHDGGLLRIGRRERAHGQLVAVSDRTIAWRGAKSSLYVYLEQSSDEMAHAVLRSFTIEEVEDGLILHPDSYVDTNVPNHLNIRIPVDGLGVLSVMPAEPATVPVNAGFRSTAGGDLFYNRARTTFDVYMNGASATIAGLSDRSAEQVLPAVDRLSIGWTPGPS